MLQRGILHRILGCQVHGKLEVIKQEMPRVNNGILGISKLKWTGMGEFNSDVHCIFYWGLESFRRNRVAIILNKRVLNAALGCSLQNGKKKKKIAICFQGNKNYQVDSQNLRAERALLFQRHQPTNTKLKAKRLKKLMQAQRQRWNSQRQNPTFIPPAFFHFQRQREEPSATMQTP